MRACFAASATLALWKPRRAGSRCTHWLLVSSRFGVADQHRAGAMHEQGAQIAIAALGDPAMAGHAAARVLARDQPQPGGELPAVGKIASIADRGDQRGENTYLQGPGRGVRLPGVHVWPAVLDDGPEPF